MSARAAIMSAQLPKCRVGADAQLSILGWVRAKDGRIIEVGSSPILEGVESFVQRPAAEAPACGALRPRSGASAAGR